MKNNNHFKKAAFIFSLFLYPVSAHATTQSLEEMKREITIKNRLLDELERRTTFNINSDQQAEIQALRNELDQLRPALAQRCRELEWHELMVRVMGAPY